MTDWQPQIRATGERETHLERLHAAIAELIEPRVTVEKIPGWSKQRNKTLTTHRVEHLPLLVELDEAKYPENGTQSNAGGRTVPGPRSPARDAAIDHHRAIVVAAAEWVFRLGLTLRPDPAGNLAQLRGHATQLDDDMLGWLALDAARWATWGRVVCGWQAQPFRPHAPCPACERTGGLLIRPDTSGNPADACCLTCGADWRAVDGSIYVLADHVRLWTEGQSA